MKLEINYVDIKDAAFGSETEIKDNVLYINKEELLDLISDESFSHVELDLAFPGESCRIGSVSDIIQPTIKIDDEDSTFPGTLGEMNKVGSGKTIKLRGIAVLETYDLMQPSGAVLDMSGPAAEHTIFSQMIQLVINPHIADGVDKFNYIDSLKKASLTAAKYLAEAAADLVPDEVEDLSMTTGDDDIYDDEGNPLPRFAYIYQIFSHRKAISALYYGDECIHALPTIAHPNEILDGALLNNNYEQLPNGDPTYMIQNHPLIRELYNRHGKDLNFVGVIISNTPSAMVNKKRNAMLATSLAKEVLKAECVLINKEGGGHPQVDIQLNCDLAEGMGMKTGIILSEFMTTSGLSDEAVVFNTPNASAIVTTGCLERMAVPAVERVLGSPINDIDVPLEGPIMLSNRNIRGALSQLGESWYTSIKF